jgi:hypothetical protein
VIEDPEIVLVTDECMKALIEKGTEDLTLPSGKTIRLTYLKDSPLKEMFQKAQPEKGCYVLSDLTGKM